MIRSFSFSNYRSFKNEVTIDFSTDGAKPTRTIIDGEYNKIVAIYGGPASGKSTILNALRLRSKEMNFKADVRGDINAFHLDDMSISQATQEYLKDSSMRKFMINVLKRSDLGIDDVLISEGGKITFMHGSFGMEMKSQGSGVARLYCILVGIHKAAESNGVAIWDERCILHPILVRGLMRLFYTLDAQLLIATNISLEWMMDDEYLYESQIYLVEKNNNESSIVRVDKIEDNAHEDISLSDNLFIYSL